MLLAYKWLLFLLIFTSCGGATFKYAPLVNFNYKYIHKVKKHHTKVKMLTGQIYYFPQCQGQAIYIQKYPSGYLRENFVNTKFFDLSLDLCNNYYFNQPNMCMTCKSYALPGFRLESNCKSYNASYWHLTKVKKNKNPKMPDTLIMKKKLHIKLNSPVLLLPK